VVGIKEDGAAEEGHGEPVGGGKWAVGVVAVA